MQKTAANSVFNLIRLALDVQHVPMTWSRGYGGCVHWTPPFLDDLGFHKNMRYILTLTSTKQIFLQHHENKNCSLQTTLNFAIICYFFIFSCTYYPIVKSLLTSSPYHIHSSGIHFTHFIYLCFVFSYFFVYIMYLYFA
jgi:hypothetical protein